MTHSADPAEHAQAKVEHQDLEHLQPIFVEIYVPVHDPSGESVQVVIEFYKNPRSLVAALDQLRLYIALGAAASGPRCSRPCSAWCGAPTSPYAASSATWSRTKPWPSSAR